MRAMPRSGTNRFLGSELKNASYRDGLCSSEAPICIKRNAEHVYVFQLFPGGGGMGKGL